MLRTILIVFIQCICIVPLYCSTIVQTFQGPIQGTNITPFRGRQIAVFLGIPYAQPPIGKLRFSNPLPGKPWKGIFDATKDGSPCPQPFRGTVIGDEDCLILNVYVSEEQLTSYTSKITQEKLPVMTFIHGGAFTMGNSTSSAFSPELILDHDVVLVTMNYRLGALGLLSTGDVEAPGNFALKDQNMALRWIQKNIAFFGGDPDQVTLLGQSAGAVDVNLHALSDLSDGLFQRYMMFSGTAFLPWIYFNSTTSKQRAINLGMQVGCPTDTSAELVDCLQNTDVSLIVSQDVFINPLLQPFGGIWCATDEPEMEGAFLTDSPENLIKQGNMKDYPWVAGIVRNEALIITEFSYFNDTTYRILMENLDDILHDLLSPYAKNITDTIKDAKQLYLNGDTSDKNRTLHQVAQMFTDIAFYYPLQTLIDLRLNNLKSPLYLYRFEYRGLYSYTFFDTGHLDNIGVSHSDDLLYLFPSAETLFGLTDTLESDIKMRGIITDFWFSFANTGVPSTTHMDSSVPWRPYQESLSHLVIGNDTELTFSTSTVFHNKEISFWREHLRLTSDNF